MKAKNFVLPQFPAMGMVSRYAVIALISSMLSACNGAGASGPGRNTTAYKLGGTVTGLTADGLVLANGGTTLRVSSDATSFNFAAGLPNGTAYSVSVQSAPASLTCNVANGAGTVANANVNNVAVTCTPRTYTLGGTITGLTGSGLVLANGGVTANVAAGATSFSFATGLASGTAYAVTVHTQPSGQTCTVTDGSGTVGSANIANIRVSCATTASGAQVTLSVLHVFSGTDGMINGPAPLIQATDGLLYGTTDSGVGSVCGTVFKVTTAGTFTNLHSFNCSTDGESPSAGVTQGQDGNFYGIAAAGGPGEVFEVTSGGTFSIFHEFTLQHDPVVAPSGALVLGPDGNLYGVTEHYSTLGTGGDYGSVYKLDKSGTVTALGGFDGGSSGLYPESALIVGPDGNLYGTTGGLSASPCSPSDCGTVFKATPGGGVSNIYAFGGAADGGVPRSAPLTLGQDGNFYGTTTEGGTSNFGTIFKITPSGDLTTLHSFSTGNNCDAQACGLVLAKDGNFYGLTGSVLFRMTPSGVVTSVYTFGKDPNNPQVSSLVTALVAGSDGNLYGTTDGGLNSAGPNGVIFKLSLGVQ